jgi:hypothetical protein
MIIQHIKDKFLNKTTEEKISTLVWCNCLNNIQSLYLWSLEQSKYKPDFSKTIRNCSILHPTRICRLFDNLSFTNEEQFNYTLNLNKKKNLYLVKDTMSPSINKDLFFNPVMLSSYRRRSLDDNIFILPITNLDLVSIGCNATEDIISNEELVRETYLVNSTKDKKIDTTLNLINLIINDHNEFEEGMSKFIYIKRNSWDIICKKFDDNCFENIGMKSLEVHPHDIQI